MLGLLATGGMAEVYLALSGDLSGFRQLVVVKRILPRLASNGEFIRMFFDEARIAALLDHPNVVRILEVGQDGDEYFLAMEVVQGKPLSAVVREAARQKQPLTQPQLAFIVAQAAKGLGYAHDLADADGQPLNVVHRDVSPQNILVSYGGTVKVIDFGVARAVGRVTETRPGGIKGKIQYMAPEQAMAGPVDRRSDVFALGVVLWEALCERRLFRRGTELETLRAIVEEPIPPPSMVVPISARLERIVMRALEKDPEARFQSAQEMALALERHAFASEGFDPAQVATAMQALFASDHARWKRTFAAANTLEGAPEQWRNTSGTFLRPHAVDLGTRATAAVPRRAPALASVPLGSAEDTSSSSRFRTSEELSPSTPPIQPKRSNRRWMAGAVALVCAGALLAAFARSYQRPPVSPPRPAAVAATWSVQVESLPPRLLREDPVPPQTAARAPGAGELSLADPTPAPPPEPAVASRAPDATPASPVAKSPSLAVAPHGPHMAPTRERGARRLARLSKRMTREPKHGGAGARASANNRGSKTTSRASASGGGCALILGARPWAEIWIDGKNTRAHTPYSESIGCGMHKVTFKRPDLGLAKTFNVVLPPGETLKQTFSLEGD
jgi:eukaryotic-like serine/threonine-protein kinase